MDLFFINLQWILFYNIMNYTVFNVNIKKCECKYYYIYTETGKIFLIYAHGSPQAQGKLVTHVDK